MRPGIPEVMDLVHSRVRRAVAWRVRYLARHELEDIEQAAMVAALEALRSWQRIRGPWQPYVATSVRNATFDMLAGIGDPLGRKAWRRGPVPPRVDIDEVEMVDPAPGPEQLVIRGELQGLVGDRLRVLLERLPPHLRSAAEQIKADVRPRQAVGKGRRHARRRHRLYLDRDAARYRLRIDRILARLAAEVRS